MNAQNTLRYTATLYEKKLQTGIISHSYVPIQYQLADINITKPLGKEQFFMLRHKFVHDLHLLTLEEY